jgi:hypothetical protein
VNPGSKWSSLYSNGQEQGSADLARESKVAIADSDR